MRDSSKVLGRAKRHSRAQGVQEVQGAQKVQEIELAPNGPVVALNIPAGQWHTVEVLESGTVILEVKDGPYQPLSPEDIMEV